MNRESTPSSPPLAPSRTPWRRYAIPAVVLLTGIGLSLALFVAIRRYEQLRAETRFENAVSDRIAAMETGLTADLLVLQGRRLEEFHGGATLEHIQGQIARFRREIGAPPADRPAALACLTEVSDAVVRGGVPEPVPEGATP